MSLTGSATSTFSKKGGLSDSLLSSPLPLLARTHNHNHSKPPWRFIVLGKQSMRSMQELTLRYYDEKDKWRAAGRWADEEAYARWREMTEGEITGRWGPVSYMIAIVMRRQAGSKRVPEWEVSRSRSLNLSPSF